MALSRKYLTALGIEADKVDEIISAHTETVDGLKDELKTAKADAAKLPEVQAELDALKKEAAKDGGKNPFEVKYNALKEEFESYKKAEAEKATLAAKQNAYRELLKEAKVSDKRIEAVLRVSDVGSVKLDADGKIEGKDSLLKSIQTEWADFITKPVEKGADTPNPPAPGGSVDYDSMSDRDYYKATYEAQKKKG